MSQIFALISPQSELHSIYLSIFGITRIPLVDARLTRSDGPDVKDACFFRVDWKQFNAQQLYKFATWASSRFSLPADEVLRQMRNPEHGLPLLESHVLTLEPQGTQIERPVRVGLPNGPIDTRFF